MPISSASSPSAVPAAIANLCIADLLQTRATTTPDTPALLAVDRPPITYGQLYAQVQAVAAALKEQGIGHNDRIAVTLPNGPDMAVAFLAIAATATCAPLNCAYRQEEFDFYLSDLEAKALITQPGVAEPARAVAQAKGLMILEATDILEFSIQNSKYRKAEASYKTQNSPLPSTTLREPFHPSADDIALVLHTSGTTSRPKIVPLSHRNLCTSADNIRRTLALQPDDRCLNVMPLFHIHGLIGALLSSLTAGASVVCTPGFYAPKILDWLAAHQATWYSAVPTMHQQILSRAIVDPERVAQLALRLIRSSSAPLPPQVMAELERVFQAPVIESYGMTEASHQMTSNPLPPQPRKPGSVGIAAGPQVAIMDEAGNLLPTHQVGEVVIQGANVTQGYANNPTANASAFTQGWFRTGDLGYFDDDRYLFLKGRIKEIINRGGEKISPREVDEVLLDHPAIDQVVTFAAPHTLLGEDVAVAVVLKENAVVTEQALKEFAAQRLADFKVPRVVLFLDEIPKGPTGKRQRIGLAAKLGLTASDPTAVKPAYLAPRTPLETALIDIWSEVLAVSPIGVDDNFFQLGGDSILATQIVNRVREQLQVELSFLVFFQQPTPAKMAVSIAQLQAEAVDADELAQLLTELEALPNGEP